MHAFAYEALARAHLDFPMDASLAQATPEERLQAVQMQVERQPGGLAWVIVPSDQPPYVLAANTGFAEAMAIEAAGQQFVTELPGLAMDITALVDQITMAAEGGQRGSFTLRQQISNDQQRFVMMAFSRLSAVGEVPARVAITASDVTERRRVHLVARHAMQLIQAMIQGIQEYAVFMLNPEGQIVTWNDGAARLLGKTGQQIVGHHVSNLTVDRDKGMDWGGLIEETRAKRSALIRTGILHRGGHRFHGTVMCSIVLANEQERGFVLVIHDLSDKLNSEQTIRASEQRFKDFAESASDWFWETDENLNLKYLSENFQQRLGVSPDYLLGRAHYQFSDMHEGADAWWEHLRALNLHKPFRSFRYTITLPDGRLVHITDSGKPIIDAEGHFIGYRGAGRDITHEVRAREAANTAAHRFFLVMDAASEAILLFDDQRRLVFWNRRTVSMFPMLERRLANGLRYSTLLYLMGKNISADQRLGPRGLRDIFNTAASLIGTTLEVRMQDGRHLRIVERHTNEDGVTVVISDITNDVNREQQVRQSYKMEALGQLTGGVAHDFNNLLTVMRGNLEMVEPHVLEAPKLLKRVRNALDAVTRGAELTARLLGFARQQPAHSQRINLAAELEALIPLLRQAIGTSVQFHQQITDVGFIDVDTSQLDNAILNLCINARDAMPEGGDLTLSVMTFDGLPPTATDDLSDRAQATIVSWALLQVQDTGTGMRDEVLHRVFDPFFTTKEHGKGSGLGLSMVYGFTRRSRGYIDIESTVGIGTTVRVYLPLVAQAEVDTEVEAQAPRMLDAPLHKGSETILLVEDNAEAREIVSAMLMDLGYDVLVAPDGASAVPLIKSAQHLDLVLTDFAMPGGVNGLDLARVVLEERPGVGVIFMSGYAEAMPDRTGTPMADIHLMQKPFSMSYLSQTLRQVLQR